MNTNFNTRPSIFYRGLAPLLACVQMSLAVAAPVAPSNVPLANIDVVPSNVVLSLSVEFPTGDTSSFLNSDPNYSASKVYYGYFEPDKCYSYSTTDLYFSPATCSSTTTKGNFLNWASMTSIDQFRQILTGGNRYVDTTTKTVLRRSFIDTQGSNTYFPQRYGKYADAGPLGSTTQNTVYRNEDLGDKMLVQKNATTVSVPNLSATEMGTKDCAGLVTQYKTDNGGASPPWTCYHIRVLACSPGSDNPDQCTKYGTSYKPEGLIQQYHRNMRFAAFGYLNDQLRSTQGGVLRARMKSVGPTIADALAGSIANAAKEWDANTGIFYTNPDPADATASSTLSATTISNSGVINYLNKFGYYSATGVVYKQYDPTAELYYETIRYLRGLTPSTQAVSEATAANAVKFDGFPVIKFKGVGTVDDPITSACQPSFNILIGDVNNHCDTRVPGGSTNATCTGSLPTDTISFAAPTNQIDTWETTVACGATDSPGRYAGWFLGGLAYWAHVNDIRPEKAAGRVAGTIENVTSYFFDVLEPYNGMSPVQTGTSITPFWTAAKYGGFDLTLTDQSSTTTKVNPNTFKSGSTVKSWDIDGNGVPDNWFSGNDPLTVKLNLAKVFDKIAAAGTIGEGAAPSTSGVSLSTASKLYYASYSLANGGRGSVKACGFTSTNCDVNPDWDSALWLTPCGSSPLPACSTGYTYQTPSSRQIITHSGGVGKPFLYASLSTTDQGNMGYDPTSQVADLVATPTIAERRVNYLRGDSSYEIQNNGGFRSRFGTLLGDIVGSGPVYVGPPSALYSGDKFPGYSAYIAANLTRTPVIYAGANDGMLHAFRASDGKEMFAYIPGYFLQPESGKNAARISSLTDRAYLHSFFVDATPLVGDVLVGTTWKTLLIGGYGAGGKGFYALDVTNPGMFASAQTNASSLSKWEISDLTNTDGVDIGYTYNQPTSSPISGQALQFALVPTGASAHRWAFITGNGFGSTNGNAVLLFIDPDTGSIFNKITVGTASDNGLATPFPMDTDKDGVVDTIWVGDLNGTMWRIRWDKANSNWVSTAIFNAGATQPITSAPAVTAHCSVAGAYNVVFGTGKYIERPDYLTTTQQTIYGVLDNLSNSTVSKTDLVQQSIVSESAPNSSTGDITRTYSENTVDFTTKKGWYLDLPTVKGERVVSNPVIPADTGVALVGSFTPATACLPIDGYVNVLDACKGGQAYDRSGTTAVALNGFGGRGAGIPYFSPPVTDRGRAITITSPSTRPGYILPGKDRVEIGKAFNRGMRASWRQIR